jgi:hypothetical protein
MPIVAVIRWHVGAAPFQIDVGSVVAISRIEMQTLDVSQAVAMIELARGGASLSRFCSAFCAVYAGVKYAPCAGAILIWIPDGSRLSPAWRRSGVE